MCIPRHCPRRDIAQEEMKVFRCGRCCRRNPSHAEHPVSEANTQIRQHSRHRVGKQQFQ